MRIVLRAMKAVRFKRFRVAAFPKNVFIAKLETKNVVLLSAIWEAFYIPRDADNAVYPRI